eukprot:233256-Hanusia_phi.AAC.2
MPIWTIGGWGGFLKAEGMANSGEGGSHGSSRWTRSSRKRGGEGNSFDFRRITSARVSGTKIYIRFGGGFDCIDDGGGIGGSLKRAVVVADDTESSDEERNIPDNDFMVGEVFLLELLDISMSKSVDQAQFDAISRIIDRFNSKFDLLRRCSKVLFEKIKHHASLDDINLDYSEALKKLFYAVIGTSGRGRVEDVPFEFVEFFIDVYRTAGVSITDDIQFRVHLCEFFLEIMLNFDLERIPHGLCSAYKSVLLPYGIGSELETIRPELLVFAKRMVDIMRYMLEDVNIDGHSSFEVIDEELISRDLLVPHSTRLVEVILKMVLCFREVHDLPKLESISQEYRALSLAAHDLLKAFLCKVESEGASYIFEKSCVDDLDDFLKYANPEFRLGTIRSLEEYIINIESNLFLNNYQLRMDVLRNEIKTVEDLKQSQQQVQDCNTRCIVCFDPCRKAAIPCGHMLICESCVWDTSQHAICPYCRQPIEQVLRIFGVEGSRAADSSSQV